jgi:hypothetical protein
MGGTVTLNTAQFVALHAAIEECGMGVIKTSRVRNIRASLRAALLAGSALLGKLAFNLDQHGKRTSAPVYS